MLIVGGILSLGAKLPLGLAFVFGALIAATDPVSVVAIFRELGAPKRLEVLLESESLFNDGTAIVIFGSARKIIFSYQGNPGIGSLRIHRAALGAGTLEWEEYSHFTMISRLTAGASGVPFLPMNPTGVDDLPKANANYRTVVDPYSGRELVTVPPLHQDVAIVHVQRVAADGNCHLWGILGEQKEAAFASTRVIRSDPNRTMVPGLVVDAVCHVPCCANPSYTQGYYDRENAFYLEWDHLPADPERVKAWLDEWVFGVPDRGPTGRSSGPRSTLGCRSDSAGGNPLTTGSIERAEVVAPGDA